MSLKTGRKGKYKGGSFASTFRAGIAMKSPFNEVAVASNEAADEMPRSPADGAAAAANAEPKSNPNDIIPSDTEYSREEVDAYFQRRKLAKEKEELEKLKKEQDPTTPGEGDETPPEDPTGDGGTIGFSDDYDETDTAKSIREENRENKKEIREAAKAEKEAAKSKFKDAKADIKASGVKGKAKRQAKKAARQDKKADKKDIRKSKKAAKKDNRAKKKAAKKARKGRK